MKKALFFSVVAGFVIIASNLLAVDFKVVDLGITAPGFVCQGVPPAEAQNNAQLRVVVIGPSQHFIVAWGIVQNGQQIEKGRQTVPPASTTEKVLLFSLNNIESGSYRFWAKMDPDGALYGDSNLSNNYLEKMQNLQKCPRDLKAFDLVIETQITPESIGNLVSVKYVIKNEGFVRPLPSVAELKANGTVVGTCNVPRLEKNATFECKSWWKYKCPVTLTFTADSTNTNDEINENNNESYKYYYPCPIKKLLNKNDLMYDAAKKK
jgi:hypothetical protein